jgi:hypothetical protein
MRLSQSAGGAGVPTSTLGRCGADAVVRETLSLAAAASGMPTGQGGRKPTPIIDADYRTEAPGFVFGRVLLSCDRSPLARVSAISFLTRSRSPFGHISSKVCPACCSRPLYR